LNLALNTKIENSKRKDKTEISVNSIIKKLITKRNGVQLFIANQIHNRTSKTN